MPNGFLICSWLLNNPFPVNFSKLIKMIVIGKIWVFENQREMLLLHLTIVDNWTANSVSKVKVYFHAKSTNLWFTVSTIIC